MFTEKAITRRAALAAGVAGVAGIGAAGLGIRPVHAAPEAPGADQATLVEIPKTSVPTTDPQVQAVLAQDPNLTYLGQPVQVSAPGPSTVGTMDGRSVAFLTYKGVAGSENPAVLHGYDILTGELMVEAALPLADQARALAISSDGRLYIGTYFDQRLWQFDPETKELRDLGSIEPTPTDAQPYGLCAGPDGQMFISTYKSAGLYSYDPGADKITKVANVPGSTGKNTYLHAVAWDSKSNDVYVASGGDKAEIWRLADGGTGAQTRITTEENTPGLESEVFVMGLWLYSDHLVARTKNLNVLVVGVDGVVDHWDHTRAFTGYHVVPSLDGSKVYWTGAGVAELMEYDFEARTKTPTGKILDSFIGDAVWQPNGDLAGAGADCIFLLTAAGEYSVVAPWEFTNPVAVQKLLAGPEGLMFASGYPEGLAQVDTTGGGIVHPSLTGGQYESSIVRDGQMYVGSYGNAVFSSFDPTQPTVGPKAIFNGLEQAQDRPFAMAYNPDRDEAYMGSVAGYGKVQGGVAVYDFATKEHTWFTTEIVDAVVDDSGAEIERSQSIISVAYNEFDKLLYIGTNVDGGLGAPDLPGAAKLVVWDPATRTKVRELYPVYETEQVDGEDAQVPRAEGITGLMVDPDGLVWGFAEGTLFIYDPAREEVLETHRGIGGKYGVGKTYWAYAYQYRSAIDGQVYASTRGGLARIDSATREWTRLLTEGAAFSQIDDRGDIYLSAGPNVYRYVVPQPMPNRMPTRDDLILAEQCFREGRSVLVSEDARHRWSQVYQRLADRVIKEGGR